MNTFQLELAKAIEELALDKGMKVNELIEVDLTMLKSKDQNEK